MHVPGATCIAYHTQTMAVAQRKLLGVLTYYLAAWWFDAITTRIESDVVR